MTLPTTFMIDAPGDAARAAELRRIKWLATLLLATTFALFIAARAFVHVHPPSDSSRRLRPSKAARPPSARSGSTKSSTTATG